MRARILNTFGYANSLDALVAHLHAEAIPAAMEQAGYRGMLVLGDRSTQHVIIVTLWHRAVEERASAHGVFLETQLREAAPMIGLRTTHEAFDVLLTEWPADQTSEDAPIDAAPSHGARRSHTMSTMSNIIVIEPTTQAWLADLVKATAAGPPLYELSPQDARAFLRAVQTSVPVDQPPADIDDRVIPGGPTGEVQIRIIRPRGVSGMLPVIVHCHGGGWILGDRDTHERLDRELANAAQAAIVFVGYTPAPDAHYPVQNEQAYTALEWAVAHAAEFGGDGSRVALFGESVGGNMAAALTLMAKQRGGPRLAAQVICYPVTDAGMDTESYRQYANGPWLTRQAMRWFWDAYLPETERRAEITASPLRASREDLHGLPPALIINGEHDVLRDEGEAYARKLAQAGVRVTQVRYGGTIHDFMLLNPIAGTPAVRAAIAQAAGFLRDALTA